MPYGWVVSIRRWRRMDARRKWRGWQNWRKSHDAFAKGVPSLKKVAAAVELDAIDYAPVTAGVDGLARAEAAIAKLATLK